MAQTNVLVWCGQYIKGQTRQGQLKGNMRVKILNALVKKNIKSAKLNNLGTVPPFGTADTFCASRVWSEIIKFLKEFAY